MSKAEIEKLTNAAWESGYNPTGVSLLEEAVRLADSMQDKHLQWDLRDDLVAFAAHGGKPERALVTFAWMVAHEEDYAADDPWVRQTISWKYKWMLEQTVFMHELPLSQLDRLADELEDRYRDDGSSLRPFYNLRAWQLFWTGREAWRDWRRKWLEAPRDGGADCLACESNFEAFYAFESGDWTAARRAARGILRGDEFCAEIPQITYGYILPAIEHANGLERALTRCAEGYRKSLENPDFVMEIGGHIAFLSHHGRIDEALALFERHARWPAVNSATLRNAHFFAATAGLLERDDLSILPIHLPDDFAGSATDGGHDRKRLLEELEQRIAGATELFDTRNQNTSISRRLRGVRRYAAGGQHRTRTNGEDE